MTASLWLLFELYTSGEFAAMGIHHDEVPPHWNYFFCLEDDISRFSRWVEFKPENESVYSIELARLLMTASAETDVVAKALCKAINPKSKASSINAYQKLLVAEYPKLPKAIVKIPRYGQILMPWDEWKTPDSPPYWWTGNNKVKHHRAEHFKEASLKNVLNSVAGLFVLLILLHSRDRPSLYPGPKLFEPGTFAYRDGDGLVFSANV